MSNFHDYEYFKISSNQNGEAIVEVICNDPQRAITHYCVMRETLEDRGIILAKPKANIEISENAKQIAQVTVKIDDEKNATKIYNKIKEALATTITQKQKDEGVI